MTFNAITARVRFGKSDSKTIRWLAPRRILSRGQHLIHLLLSPPPPGRGVTAVSEVMNVPNGDYCQSSKVNPRVVKARFSKRTLTRQCPLDPPLTLHALAFPLSDPHLWETDQMLFVLVRFYICSTFILDSHSGRFFYFTLPVPGEKILLYPVLLQPPLQTQSKLLPKDVFLQIRSLQFFFCGTISFQQHYMKSIP